MILVLVLQDLQILLLSHILGLYLDPCFLSICWLARALMALTGLTSVASRLNDKILVR